MELILIRHGTTQGNLERRFIGTLDVPLAPQGEELARRVGPTLPPVEHIYRSPLMRCRQTAELLWPGVDMTVIDQLRESDFAMPVGETAQQVVDRVSIGLERLAKDAQARGFQRIGVVSHGGALMGLFSKYGRPERAYYDWMCPNCGGFRMALDPATLELTVLEEYRG